MKKIIGITLCLLLTVLCACALAETVTVTVEGTYGQSDARSMLQMVNDFRTGPDAWYWNESNTEKVFCTGLQKLEYDYALEQTAMQRAIEVAMIFSHTRPDGTGCFTAFPSGSYASGENIAAGSVSAEATFRQWEEADKDYSGQGHRRNMLRSYYNRIGIGHVELNGFHYWTQALGYFSSAAPGATAALDSKATKDVVVDITYITTITADDMTIRVDETAELPATGLKLDGTWPSGATVSASLAGAAWTVSAPDRILLENGRVVGLSVGSADLIVTLNNLNAKSSVTVNPAQLSGTAIQVADTAAVYNGTEHKPAVTVTSSRGNVLTAGTDYSITYSDNINAGNATVSVKGKGNYTGMESRSFTISPADMADAVLDPIPDQAYTGREICPTVTGTIHGAPVRTSDYTATWKDNVNTGTAGVVLTGTGNLKGTASLSFCILPRALADCALKMPAGQLYLDGVLHTSVELNYDGFILKEGRDYTLGSAVNAEAGTGTYTITGTGNFTGTRTADFTLSSTIEQDGARYRPVGNSVVLEEVISAKASSLKIPDNVNYGGQTYPVTAVADGACRGMKKLKKLTIGKKVTAIGTGAFEDCAKLSTVLGGAGLTTIGDRAFCKCKALTAFTFGKKVARIGKDAFNGCKKLMNITIKTTKLTKKTIGKNCFKGIAAKAVFKCPKKMLKKYTTWLKKPGGAPKTATIR